MARHIDADQMIADTEAMKQVCEAIEIDGIIKYIEEHIAADVEEVKHAQWKQNKGDSAQRFYCTTCFEYGNPNYQYCPYCGAKMDGKKEEND